MGDLPRHKLSDADIQDALKSLPGWTVKNGKLHREYQFEDFVKAFGFMASVALVAESMSHHPEWFNVYHTVGFDLWTHSIPGISNLDAALAAKVEALAKGAGARSPGRSES
jgi:4a-hydroxytetrahydrobiopterin dehydratase